MIDDQDELTIEQKKALADRDRRIANARADMSAEEIEDEASRLEAEVAALIAAGKVTKCPPGPYVPDGTVVQMSIRQAA